MNRIPFANLHGDDKTLLGMVSRSQLLLALTFVISCMLSAVAIIRDPVINGDGILYVLTAQDYLSNGLNSALQSFSWPGLSVLMAWLHQLTGLSLENSGYLIASFGFALTCTVFVMLTRLIGGTLSAQVVAALVVLTLPGMNDNRGDLIRDSMYWGALLSTFYCVLKYQSARNLSWIFAALAFATLATVFRIEGVLLFGLVPLSILLFSDIPLRHRLTHALTVAGAVTLFATILIFALRNSLETSRLVELIDTASFIWGDFIDRLRAMGEQVGAAALGRFNHDMGPELAIMLVLVAISIKLIKSSFFGWFLVAVGNGIFGSPSISPDHSRIIKLWMTGIAAVLFIYVVRELIITGRYVKPIALLLLLWVPHVLVRWLHSSEIKSRQVIKVSLLGLLFLGLAIKSVSYFEPSRKFHLDAADWIEQNIPVEDSVWSNKMTILYYADRATSDVDTRHNQLYWAQWLAKREWSEYQWLVFALRENRQPDIAELNAMFGAQPYEVITSDEGYNVAIWKLDSSD